MANLYKTAFRLAIFLLLPGLQILTAAQDCSGTIDPSFNPIPLGWILAILPDGERTVAAASGVLLRLDENGLVDTRFIAEARTDDGWRAEVLAVDRDNQGRWLLGGDFAYVNRTACARIARILPNAQVDSSFTPPTTFSERYGQITKILSQADGKILVLGSILTTNSLRRSILLRLFANGEIDSSFAVPVADFEIRTIAPLSNGQILAGGEFKTIGGKPRNQLCRLNSDGSLDETFVPARVIPEIGFLKPLGDGRFLAAEGPSYIPVLFENDDIPTTRSLVRFNADGSLDATFHPPPGPVASVAIQSDGKYLISGKFAERGNPNRFFKRILPDGTEDSSFSSIVNRTGTDWTPGAGGIIALDSKERVLVTGSFDTVNGLQRAEFARLLNDGQPCVPLISFETNHIIALETNGFISIPILRSGNTDPAVGIEISFKPVEWIDQEDLPPATNVIFSEGSVLQSIQVPIIENHRQQRGRTFQALLGNPADSLALGRYSTVDVTILDSSSALLPGAIDTSFTPQLPLDDQPQIIVTPDQKLLLPRAPYSDFMPLPISIDRFNLDGSHDTNFDYHGPDFPRALACWNDKIYLLSNGIGSNKIVRLLADGSRDTNFQSPNFRMDYFYDSSLSAMCVDPDGKIVVAGLFTNINGIRSGGLARINTDGSVDPTFHPPDLLLVAPNPGIIVGLGDRGYLIAGEFLQFGAYRFGMLPIAKNGSRLNTFDLSLAYLASEVNAIAVQSDGGVLLGGVFEKANQSGTDYLVRFAPDGLLDPTFIPPQSSLRECAGIVVQNNGKIIVTGSATTFTSDPAQSSLFRLNSDASLDPTFNAHAIGGPYGLALDALGNLYVRGAFRSFNGFPQSNLVRLKTGDYSGAGIFKILGSTNVFENAGAVKLRLRREASITGEALLRVRTHEGIGHDFVPMDQIFKFADGQSGEQEFDVTIVKNPERNVFDYFTVDLSTETPGAIIADGFERAYVSTADDQSGFYFDSAPTVAFEEQGELTFTVRRLGIFNGPASVQVVADGGSAIAGEDYEPLNTTLHFETSSDVVQTVSLRLLNDNIAEPDKEIHVSLRDPSSGSILYEPSTANVMLKEVREQFELNGVSMHTVQNFGTASLYLSPSSSSRGAQTVQFTYSIQGGTAVPGVEFVETNGVITFGPFDSNPKKIVIPLLSNSIVGEPTTIKLAISVTAGEATLLNPEATVYLHHPPAVAPAGAIDQRFPQLSDSTFNPIIDVDATAEFLYLSGPFGPQGLIRYKHDGTLDSSYQPKPGYYRNLIPLAEMKLMAIIDDGANHVSLVRLDASGSIDPGFLPGLASLFNIQEAVEANGRFLVTGTYFVGNITQSFLFILRSDGQFDQTFSPPLFNTSEGLHAVFQPDGKILVSGFFSQVNGIPRENIVRLLANGDVDLSFSPPSGLIYFLEKIIPLPSGDFLAGGTFSQTNQGWRGIHRFKMDGSLDTVWTFERNQDDVSLERVDSQGRIYALVQRYTVAAGYSSELLRASSDGKIDTNFLPPSWALIAVPYGEFIWAIGNSWAEGAHAARLFADSPTMLRPPTLLPAGKLRHIFSARSGSSFSFEATEDFRTWREIAAGVASTNFLEFETAAPLHYEFYRVRQD